MRGEEREKGEERKLRFQKEKKMMSEEGKMRGGYEKEEYSSKEQIDFDNPK